MLRRQLSRHLSTVGRPKHSHGLQNVRPRGMVNAVSSAEELPSSRQGPGRVITARPLVGYFWSSWAQSAESVRTQTCSTRSGMPGEWPSSSTVDISSGVSRTSRTSSGTQAW